MAFVQDEATAGSPAPTLSRTLTATAGNCLVLVVGAPGTFSSVSDGVNTWQSAVNYAPGQQVAISYALNVAGGSTTVTATFLSGAQAQIVVAEFSGVAIASALDLTNTNAETGQTAHDFGGLTGPTANSVVILVARLFSGINVTVPPSGYTALDNAASPFFRPYYKIKTDGVNETPTYTTQFAEDTTNAMASFKPAVVAGSILRQMLQHHH